MNREQARDRGDFAYDGCGVMSLKTLFIGQLQSPPPKFKPLKKIMMS